MTKSTSTLPTTRILRLPEVLARTGYKTHAQVYGAIKDGLFTSQVPIGERTVGWPDYEIDAINAARIAGKTESETRALVACLHARREELARALDALYGLQGGAP